MQTPDPTIPRDADTASTALLPRPVRHTVLTVVGLLLAVAVYLMVVRGPALLFDLARSAMAYCF